MCLLHIRVEYIAGDTKISASIVEHGTVGNIELSIIVIITGSVTTTTRTSMVVKTSGASDVFQEYSLLVPRIVRACPAMSCEPVDVHEVVFVVNTESHIKLGVLFTTGGQMLEQLRPSNHVKWLVRTSYHS